MKNNINSFESRMSMNLQRGASHHLQGFEDKNLGSSPSLLGQ